MHSPVVHRLATAAIDIWVSGWAAGTPGANGLFSTALFSERIIRALSSSCPRLRGRLHHALTPADSSTADGKSMEAQVDIFRILALGPTAAGKTVYLAALEHALRDSHFGSNIAVSTVDIAQGNKLRRIYAETVNPAEPWSQHTSAGQPMQEFTFRFTVNWTHNRRFRGPKVHQYTAFDVSYVDYAGEWLRDEQQAPDDVFHAFNKRKDEANAVLLVINGVRLLQFMQNGGEQQFFDDQIVPVVNPVLSISMPIPIHFIITMWDIFEGRYTLDQVQRRLMKAQNPIFRDLVERRTAGPVWGKKPVGTVRLIPVSSIGQLAKLERNWQMSKTGKPATQLNVEIPLAAAVADVCDLAAQMLRQATKPRFGSKPGRIDRAVENAADNVRTEAAKAADFAPGYGSFTALMQSVQIIAAVFSYGGGAVKVLGRSVVRAAWSMRWQARRVRSRNIAGVRSRQASLFYLHRTLRRRLQEFEAAHPTSLLTAAPSEPVADEKPDPLTSKGV